MQFWAVDLFAYLKIGTFLIIIFPNGEAGPARKLYNIIYRTIFPFLAHCLCSNAPNETMLSAVWPAQGKQLEAGKKGKNNVSTFQKTSAFFTKKK